MRFLSIPIIILAFLTCGCSSPRAQAFFKGCSQASQQMKEDNYRQQQLNIQRQQAYQPIYKTNTYSQTDCYTDYNGNMHCTTY